MDADALQSEAMESYMRAEERAAKARAEWEDHGGPLTIMQANGVLCPHPLWKVLLEAEKHASMLRVRATPKRAPGRPKGATSSPDRPSAPAPLRAVQ